jgi:pimeloyl-ACP methyl ester carboxylesterase
MRTLHDLANGRALLVMLPPARARAQDLVDQGFVATLREQHLPVDVAIVDVQADDYLEPDIGARLAAEVALLRAKGYPQLWLMGISLGGFGCMALARQPAAGVEGVILIAPFFGSRDPEALELEEQARLSTIYLGFGDADRYAEPSRRLARHLPPERVVQLPGAHDWPTWTRLWRKLLVKVPFAVEA